MGRIMLRLRSFALMVVQRQMAASKSARPCSKGQQASVELLPIPMWTRPPSTSTHAPSFRMSMGHVSWGFGDGGLGMVGGLSDGGLGMVGGLTTGGLGMVGGLTTGGLGTVGGGLGVEGGGLTMGGCLGTVGGGLTLGGLVGGVGNGQVGHAREISKDPKFRRIRS
ncbi:hypothetical protein ACS0TY_030891 [Phlomoides rotata]